MYTYFVVSAERQTFLGFEITANLRDTSPLSHDINMCILPTILYNIIIIYVLWD